MIKGHSIIELKNEVTGEVERYENDNLITNGVQKILQDLGMLYNSPIKETTFRNYPIKELFGGILLLDDNITENSNIVTVPGGIGMTANGGMEYVAQGVDGVTEFGSWNYTDSGWTADGKFKLVWDWAREHGNGIIKCACLTSRRHGYCGIGNKSGNVRESKASLMLKDNAGTYYNFDPVSPSNVIRRIVGVNVASSNVTYVDYYNLNYDSSHSAEHMGTTGKLKLMTAHLPITELDLRESYPFNNEGGQDYLPVSETEVTLPAAFVSALGNNTPWKSGKYGDYFYILASNLNLAPGASVTGVRINCTTYAVQSFTVENTTESTWNVYEWCFTFGNDRIALYDTSGTRVIFQDILNNVNTSEVDVSIGVGGGQYNPCYGIFLIKEDYAFLGNSPTYRIDMVGKTVLPVNANFLNTRFCPTVAVDNPFLYDYEEYNGGSWNAKYFFLSYAGDYIATINNLAEPITKSADKSMKVTYILSFT